MQVEFGDMIQEKAEHKTWLIFLNMRGLPYYNSLYKNMGAQQLTNNHNIDVLGLAETNLNWRKIPMEHRLGDQTLYDGRPNTSLPLIS